jgi:radical SAM protein with 4Fe4S-binding SPASM domain
MTVDVNAAVMARAERAVIPITLMIEVTRSCDLACEHCYAECGVRPAGLSGATTGPTVAPELTTEEWGDVLAEAAGVGSLHLGVTGGEPLLRPDIFEILGAARRLRFATRLMTNGTLIDAGTADLLAELGLVAVEVSVYATDPEVHDRITRTPGSHSRTMQALRLLHDRGVRLIVKTPVMGANVDEVPKVSELAGSLEAGFMPDVMITATDRGGKGPTCLRLSEEEYRQLVGEGLEHVSVRRPAARDAAESLCGAARFAAAVGADGTMLPCIGLPLAAGDVRETGFARLWRDSQVMNAVRSLRRSDLLACEECDLAGFCRRCTGAALLEGGEMTSRLPYACMLARVDMSCADIGGG